MIGTARCGSGARIGITATIGRADAPVFRLSLSGVINYNRCPDESSERLMMANEEHLEILERGVEVWNRWRVANPEIGPDLSYANLSYANLRDAILSDAILSNANLNNARLQGADLIRADLNGANLSHAKLRSADFSRAKLRSADLGNAILNGAIFIRAALQDASLKFARMGQTVFADTDLSGVKRLDSVMHLGPSSISIDTLYQSGGNIPEAFLRGCGVPDTFITFAKSLVGKAIDYYLAFISYSRRITTSQNGSTLICKAKVCAAGSLLRTSRSAISSASELMTPSVCMTSCW